MIQLVPDGSPANPDTQILSGNSGKGEPVNPGKNILSAMEIIPATPIARKDYFVLVLAPSGDRLQQFVDKKQLGETDAQIHVSYLPNASAMPKQWIGYHAVDTIVIREVALAERNISKQQQIALLDWVQHGGTLLLSGGSNFHYLQKSFVEPFLPVQMNGVETVDKIDRNALKFGILGPEFETNPVQKIRFTPKENCQIVMGTSEDIYIAKGRFGNGQILCLAFDYNAPPFSVPEIGAAFWEHLLKTDGKSPRYLAERYAPHREHERKIYKQFLLKMPTRVPLIQFIAIVLPLYLLSFGGILLYLGRTQNRARSYWIAGGLVVLIFMTAIGIGKTIFPKTVVADSASILSIYPERNRAHLQRYIALRTTMHTEISLAFDTPIAMTHLASESQIGTAETFIHGPEFQLRDVLLGPWHPRTYRIEKFFTVDAQHVLAKLENSGKLLALSPRTRTQKQFPSHEGLSGLRKDFAQILQREGVLQYLTNQEHPVASGWLSNFFADMSAGGHVRQTDEMLVLLYLEDF